jgi:hypothetical protein
MTGDLYTSNNKYNYNDLYCDTCHDSDDYIAYAETKEEAIIALRGYGCDEEWLDRVFNNK